MCSIKKNIAIYILIFSMKISNFRFFLKSRKKNLKKFPISNFQNQFSPSKNNIFWSGFFSCKVWSYSLISARFYRSAFQTAVWGQVTVKNLSIFMDFVLITVFSWAPSYGKPLAPPDTWGWISQRLVPLKKWKNPWIKKWKTGFLRQITFVSR